MEHSELVQEMARIEQLSTQERLALARRRRIQQLKGWAQRERDWLRHRPSNSQRKNNKRNIYFSDNVVLLEAAARNDIDEGNFSLFCFKKIQLPLKTEFDAKFVH